MDVINQLVSIMRGTLERGRLLLHVGCANNLIIIADLVKIGIKLIEACMFFVVTLP